MGDLDFNGFKELDEKKMKRLMDVVIEIARINTEVLDACLDVKSHADAAVQLDKLRCLVRAVRIELEMDIKLNLYQEEVNPSGLLPPSPPQRQQQHPQQLQMAQEDNDDKEDLFLQISFDDERRLRKTKTLTRRTSARADVHNRKQQHKENKDKKLSSPTIQVGRRKRASRKSSSCVSMSNCQHKSHDSVQETKSPHMCERCGKMFKSKETLRCHIRLHREKDADVTYTCAICQKEFKLKATLNSHMRMHSSRREFQCTHCGKCFVKRHSLILHMRTHNGEKPYVCKVCKKSFSLIGNLRRHEKIHSGERPWKCTFCGKAFNQSDILKSHLRTHTREKPFTCSLCGKSFSHCNYLHTHSLRAHSKDSRRQPSAKLYECTFCHRQFLYQTSLISHTMTHTGEKPYQCSICSKRFIRKIQLDIHSRTHTDDKPYKCDFCNKAFTRHSTLKLHLDVHYGKMYKCDVCQKAFNNPANLNRHLRNHSGLKPYQCQMCGRGFSQKTTLNLHMWTHTPDKRFKCQVCGKGYNDKRNLVSHSKTHSSGEPCQTTINDIAVLDRQSSAYKLSALSPGEEKMPSTYCPRLAQILNTSTNQIRPSRATIDGPQNNWPHRHSPEKPLDDDDMSLTQDQGRKEERDDVPVKLKLDPDSAEQSNKILLTNGQATEKHSQLDETLMTQSQDTGKQSEQSNHVLQTHRQNIGKQTKQQDDLSQPHNRDAAVLPPSFLSESGEDITLTQL